MSTEVVAGLATFSVISWVISLIFVGTETNGNSRRGARLQLLTIFAGWAWWLGLVPVGLYMAVRHVRALLSRAELLPKSRPKLDLSTGPRASSGALSAPTGAPAGALSEPEGERCDYYES